MAMPRGDTPQKAEQFYNYLLAHHETEHPVKTWHVNSMALAWMCAATKPHIQASAIVLTCHIR